MDASTVRAAGALLILAIAAGCSSPSVSTDAEQQPQRPVTSTTSATGPGEGTYRLNERGFLVKKLGESTVWGATSDQRDVVFTVDKIEVDPECDVAGARPQDGRHTLALHVRVTTGDNQRVADLASGVVNPWNLLEVGMDGSLHPARVGHCLKGHRLSTNFDANKNYQGLLEVHVPAGSGIIAMKNTGSTTDIKGWEWHYEDHQN